MDKKVILAIAGSGKTTYILNSLSDKQRSLIITYTENNLTNLRRKIFERFGYIPRNIELTSFFTFLHSFCFKPMLWRDYRTTGINWEMPAQCTLKFRRNRQEFYIDSHNRLYYNRISKLLATKGMVPSIIQRIEKYFDILFIDEVQDFGGHDFDFLKSLATSNIPMLWVGDFFQHTFDTSRDGNVNANIYDDLFNYKISLQRAGLTIDEDTLSRSYRCSPHICRFVSEQIGIKMQSHRKDDTEVRFIDDKREAQYIKDSRDIIKLFYSQHYNYNCFSRNWGDSKGEDQYYDVCVVLNKKSSLDYKKGQLHSCPPRTRNKIYVACTRARNNLYILPIELIS